MKKETRNKISNFLSSVGIFFVFTGCAWGVFEVVYRMAEVVR